MARTGRNAFLFIVLTVFIDMMSFAVVIPVMPRLIAELLHGADAVAAASPAALQAMLSEAAPWGGTISMVYAALNFLMQPVLGNLSDRFGRRPVLLVSMAMLGVDFLIMGFAPSIGWLFLGRTLTGISGATHSTGSAYIADVTEPEDRARAFGMLGVAFGVGFTLGPMIGGALGMIDPRAPFFASAGLAGLNFVYGLFVLPESLPAHRRRPFDWRRANALGAFLHFRQLPHLRWLLVAYGLYMFGHWVYPATFSYYGQVRYGWDQGMTGLALGAVGISAAVVQGTLIGWFIRTLGATRTTLFGFAVTIVACLAYGLAPTGGILLAIIPFGALAGVLTPALNQILTSRVARDAQGELQGALGAVQAFGAIFAPLAMTEALHTFTRADAPIYLPGAAFFLAAVVTAVALIPLAVGVRSTAPLAAPAADSVPATP